MDLALNNLQRLICHKTQPTEPVEILHSNLIHSTKIHYDSFNALFRSYIYIQIILTIVRV